MLPRPLHRWKSFWLGVLILVFLGWAWGLSFHRASGVFWLTRSFAFTAGQKDTGQVLLMWDPKRNPPGFEVLNWIHEPAPLAKRRWFPEPMIWGTEGTRIHIATAHWFLILLFLIPWTAYLIWRVKQPGRLAAR